MIKTYNSVEKLLSGCNNTTLKQHILSVLGKNPYMVWNFKSCSIEADVCRSEFTSKVQDSDMVQRLTTVLDPRGFHGHILALDNLNEITG